MVMGSNSRRRLADNLRRRIVEMDEREPGLPGDNGIPAVEDAKLVIRYAFRFIHDQGTAWHHSFGDTVQCVGRPLGSSGGHRISRTRFIASASRRVEDR